MTMSGKATIVLRESEGVKPLIVNPTYRLWTVVILLVAIVAIRQPAVLAGTAGLLLFIALWCGIPLRTILRRMLLLLPFGAGAALFVPFHTAGEPAFDVLGFTATHEGVERATVILLKLASANLLLTYLLAATPIFVLIRSLRAVGIPAVMLEIMALLLRYFFLLKEEAHGMSKAQRSRGMNTTGWLWNAIAYKRFGQLMGALFVRAYSRSGRIYTAMLARGGLEGGYPVKDEQAASGAKGPVVEVKDVGYAYGSIPALKGVSFDIAAGSKVALMGPNGAGKSTLISLLNGLEPAQAGEVRLFGEKVTRANEHRLRRSVGVVYQDPDDQIFSATVLEDVAFGPRNLGLTAEEASERAAEALESVGMLELRDRSPFELSYGQKRRVAIAGVLAMRPAFMILDEPMSFLDPRGRDELQALLGKLHEGGLTIMVATHDVDFAAEWADRVLLLKDGKLLASGTADVLFDDKLLEQASLHLPRLARPFRLLQGAGAGSGAGVGDYRPRTVKEAAQLIWKLLSRGGEYAKESGKSLEGERIAKP
ncbi:cobalt ECF transporter T component CbiQ [Cohnella sp. GCM10027633]|uniref:cobalt ECF transporter T component CbiQ n=1 Tax=unclassified Cohnella TaxID=2636738 RepID=UPI003625D630